MAIRTDKVEPLIQPTGSSEPGLSGQCMRSRLRCHKVHDQRQIIPPCGHMSSMLADGHPLLRDPTPSLRLDNHAHEGLARFCLRLVQLVG